MEGRETTSCFSTRNCKDQSWSLYGVCVIGKSTQPCTLICGGAHALEGYLDSAIDSRIIKWPSGLHREVVRT